eukprot:1318132-Rhodomonas_salina.1
MRAGMQVLHDSDDEKEAKKGKDKVRKPEIGRGKPEIEGESAEFGGRTAEIERGKAEIEPESMRCA